MDQGPEPLQCEASVRVIAEIARTGGGANARRAFLCFLIIGLFTLTASGQQPSPTPIPHCVNAWEITPADPKLAEKSDAWVTKDSDRDGILSLSYCSVFQAGSTKVKRLAPAALVQLPRKFDDHRRYAEMVHEKIRTDVLPLGVSVYRDLAFELETEAVLSGARATLRLPSVTSEAEFKKLIVLYLDEDWIVPGVLTWQIPFGTDEQKSEFKSRTLTAGFDYTTVFHHATGVGRLVVASFDQEEFDKSATDIAITSVVAPPYVRTGETFAYSIRILNSGGTNRATDVVLHTTFNTGTFVSAEASQGNCRQSVNSTPVVVCEVGTLEFSRSVVLTINIKANISGAGPDAKETVFSTMNTVRSRNKDYTPENNSHQSLGTIIRQ